MPSRAKEWLREFIDIYRSEMCLWKVESEDYYDTEKREAAYGRLIDKWKEVDDACTIENVLKKIKSLRKQFFMELKKVNASMKSGASSEELYQPKLWYFKSLTFLKDQLDISSQSKSTIEMVNDNENKEDAQIEKGSGMESETDTERGCSSSFALEVETLQNSGFAISQRTKQEKPSGPNDLIKEVLLTVQDHFNQPRMPEDRFDAFAKNVAMKLKDLRCDQRRLAEKFINEVLFEAECGNLKNFLYVQVPPQLYYQSLASIPSRCMNMIHPGSSFRPTHTTTMHGEEYSSYYGPNPL